MTEAQMREMAAQFGYARLGFCSTEPFNEWEARKPRAHKTAQRLCSAPLELAPWAKALCIVVAPYRLYRRGEGAAVSAYYVEYNAVHARGEEFVKALNVRGVQAESLEIPLKPAAIRAGLGAFGKNSIVRIHGMGSCVMLRCIALGEGFECERDYPGGEGYEYADCGKCRRCIDACPSGALSESGMDHTRCLRAHMFQGPPTPEEFRPLMGNRLLGCEICQNACLPNACETHITFTMNARELLLFSRLRTCTRAQWEIRGVARQMVAALSRTSPEIFGGYGPSCAVMGR